MITLQPQADARALAARLTSDLRIKTIRIVGSDAALERFRRAFPDIGGALVGAQGRAVPAVARGRPEARRPLRERRPRSPGPRGSGPESSRPSRKKSSRASSATPSPSCATSACFSAGSSRSPGSCPSPPRCASPSTCHREEVGIMRLMGATEGAIRAPVLALRDRGGAPRRRHRAGSSLRHVPPRDRLARARSAPGPLGLLGRIPLDPRGAAAARGGRGRGARGKPSLPRTQAHAPRHAHRLNRPPSPGA